MASDLASSWHSDRVPSDAKTSLGLKKHAETVPTFYQTSHKIWNLRFLCFCKGYNFFLVYLLVGAVSWLPGAIT